LAKGHPAAALYEVQSVLPMVSWFEDDDEFRKFARNWAGKAGGKLCHVKVRRKRAVRNADNGK
jgi:hypothetical protein